ncbi:hypothetical protein SpCBS45565_g01001 [Spizellomyces sp. 'palustris']|nr:hypothetical protein SpCBS45565_g01001 [Spizellomyces sp. 'palustris']
MAQGGLKKSGASKPSFATKKSQTPSLGPKRREGKYIAPKSKTLITQKNLQKKLAAKAIVQTEQLMAARAGATGKLTIMKSVAQKAKAEQDKAKKGKK